MHSQLQCTTSSSRVAPPSSSPYLSRTINLLSVMYEQPYLCHVRTTLSCTIIFVSAITINLAHRREMILNCRMKLAIKRGCVSSARTEWLAYWQRHSEFGAALFDDHRFYIIYTCVQRYYPLSSRLSALLSHAILIERLSLFVARFELSPKWCTYSVVLVLHGWCLMKLLSSLRILCTLYNYAPCHVTLMQSHIRSVNAACLVVTFRLHFLAE